MKFKQPAITMMALAITASSGYGMKYRDEAPVPIPNAIFDPHPTQGSGCSSDSHTVAVGYEIGVRTARILCAASFPTGFWTTPVPGTQIGSANELTERFVCPSGTAISGLLYIEGLAIPLPVCSIMRADFPHGVVTQEGHFTVGKAAVDPSSPAAVMCPAGKFLQTVRMQDGVMVAPHCNVLETLVEGRGSNSSPVNLDVRTVGQRATLGQNQIETFRVEIINLSEAVFSANDVLVEMRFPVGWDVVVPQNVNCSVFFASNGVRLGQVCRIPTDVIGRFAEATGSIPVRMVPAGPDSRRPAGLPARPIFAAKLMINETLIGPDTDDSDNRAAFPVVVQ